MIIQNSIPAAHDGCLLQQQQFIYTNACSTGRNQEELEAVVQQDDIVVIMETRWDDLHNWSAAVDGYTFFGRDKQGGRGGGGSPVSSIEF